VELIGTAFTHDYNLAAHLESILRTERVSNNSIFFDTIHAKRCADRPACIPVLVHHDGAVKRKCIRTDRRSIAAEHDAPGSPLTLYLLEIGIVRHAWL